jgi:phosphoglucosamine mutase
MGLARRIGTDARVVIDCAHGSACGVAGAIVAATGARVTVRFAEPDGVNINAGCGATAPAALAALVAADGADVGFALDGDADRCVAVDERGQVVDGDQLLGIIALDRLERARLEASTLVVSVLSNGGLADVVKGAGGRVVRTPVGDRYILDAMLVSGAGVGGEKSGHVIVREHTSSGDGIVTALEVLGILARTGRTLSELAARVPLYPQEQKTIRVRHKDQWEADLRLVDAVRAAEAELEPLGGRILVRPSGTEPALRIMVEGPDAGRVRSLADDLAALASERLN